MLSEYHNKTDMTYLVVFSFMSTRYSETLNNKYIEWIHQMSYSSLSDNGMLQIFSFLINLSYGTLKTVPAYSWLLIYFRKYWNLRNIV